MIYFPLLGVWASCIIFVILQLYFFNVSHDDMQKRYENNTIKKHAAETACLWKLKTA